MSLKNERNNKISPHLLITWKYFYNYYSKFLILGDGKQLVNNMLKINLLQRGKS